MLFIHDTRDKIGKHRNVDRYIEACGHSIVRSKMFVGDVAVFADQTVCVDLKQGLQEVYGNIISDHRRFKSEVVRARDNGIKLIVVVEEAGIDDVSHVHEWVNPRAERYKMLHEAHAAGKMLRYKIPTKPPVSSAQLEIAMRTMAERYGFEWRFCDPSETGKVVMEVLTNGRIL